MIQGRDRRNKDSTHRSRSLGTKGSTSSTVSSCLEESIDCLPAGTVALGLDEGGVCGSRGGGIRVGGECSGEDRDEPWDSLDRITGDALLGRGFLRTGDELDATIDRAE